MKNNKRNELKPIFYKVAIQIINKKIFFGKGNN
jgi:hypothetical protein